MDMKTGGSRDLDARLLDAITSGDVALVRELLEKGANVNARSDDCNRTPLHLVASSGDLEMAEILVGHGADVQALDCVDFTPVDLAARDGNIPVLLLMLERRDDIPERVIRNAMNVARMSTTSLPNIYVMLEDYLVKHVMPSTGGSEDALAMLFEGSEKGDVDTVKRAIDAGVDLEETDDRGMPALAWAALRGHLNVVKILCEAGAEIDCRNDADWTPLMEAAFEGHEDVVKYLIEQGADVNATTVVNATALMFAAGKGYPRIVDILLDAGADPYIAISGTDDEDGFTALDYAIQYGQESIARRLKEFMEEE